MGEKAYKAMKRAGIGNIVLGIISIVFGISMGILSITSGASLLKHKSKITF